MDAIVVPVSFLNLALVGIATYVTSNTIAHRERLEAQRIAAALSSAGTARAAEATIAAAAATKVVAAAAAAQAAVKGKARSDPSPSPASKLSLLAVRVPATAAHLVVSPAHTGALAGRRPTALHTLAATVPRTVIGPPGARGGRARAGGTGRGAGAGRRRGGGGRAGGGGRPPPTPIPILV